MTHKQGEVPKSSTQKEVKFKQIVQTLGNYICALSTKGDMYLYDVKKNTWRIIIMQKPTILKIKNEILEA